jgi:hypothetical protein
MSIYIYDDADICLEFDQYRGLLIFKNTGEIRGTDDRKKYRVRSSRYKDLNKLYAIRRLINMAIDAVKETEVMSEDS